MIQANIGLNWPSIFREEDFFYKSKPSTQYMKHTIELSLALNCGVWGYNICDAILKTRIIMLLPYDIRWFIFAFINEFIGRKRR
jgi:hypothetical protein